VVDGELKSDLIDYLQGARDALVWKLDGLSEYDIRRPMTPTGTNLLGLVKHTTGSHLRYFGTVFARDLGVELPWASETFEPSADMWATPEESRNEITSLYRAVCAAADTTINDLSLDARGCVPWWGDEAVTLHHVLAHVISETQRHAGHADIIRELIDGSAGLLPGTSNLPSDEGEWWDERRDRIEAAARRAAGL
jgi:uncharacterized damage-inducible protein DinB